MAPYPPLHLAVSSGGIQYGSDDFHVLREWAVRLLEESRRTRWVIFLHAGPHARGFFARPFEALESYEVEGVERPRVRQAPTEGNQRFEPGRGWIHVPVSDKARAALRVVEEATRFDAQGAEAREIVSDLLREEGYPHFADELDLVSGRTETSPFALNPRSFFHLKKHSEARALVHRLPGLYAAVRYVLSKIA